MRTKVPGNMVVYGFALSAMILTLGQSILRLQGAEMQFSANLYYAEQAYYAAESGLEQSLMWLENEPLEYLKDYAPEELLPDVEQAITIENNLPEFSFMLGPEEAKQFTLQVDTDPNNRLGASVPVETIGSFQLIADTDGVPVAGVVNTYELNLCLGSPQNSIEASSANGAPKTVSNPITNGKCIVQITNQNVATSDPNENAERTMTFTFTRESGMSPHRAQITSIGKAGTREKHLSFGLERNKSIFNRNLFVQ